MKQSEYLVDRLKAEVQHYKDIADILEREYKTLQEECKFGVSVALVAGLVIGIVIGTAISWV